jgi:hypothetical protein
MMAMVDNDSDGRQQQWRTTKVADDDGMQDQAADYEGEGGERAANNNGMRPAGQRARNKKKIKKTFFRNLVCPGGVFTPA